MSEARDWNAEVIAVDLDEPLEHQLLTATPRRRDGKRIPGIPLHQLQASVTWRWGQLFFTGEGIMSSRVLVDDANTAAAAGWAIANVRTGGRIRIGG